MQLRKTWHFQQIESRFQLIENKNDWIVIDMDVKTRSENWLCIKNIQQNYQLIEKCRSGHYTIYLIEFNFLKSTEFYFSKSTGCVM